jgi:hypothetical protein
MLTTGARDSAGRPPTTIMQMDGISLLDPEDDEIARGLTPVTALLGPADLATLDTLITAGIATSRAEAARWALARLREQPAYAQLSEAAAGAQRAPGAGRPGAGRAGATANQARWAGESAFPRGRGAAGRLAATRRGPVGRAGRPAGPGIHRALTLARYAILVEAGHSARIRRQLAGTGSRVNAWFANWLALIGSADTDHDVHVLGNYLTGLMLHQLAIPDPGFDPEDEITALLESLARPAGPAALNPAPRRDRAGT